MFVLLICQSFFWSFEKKPSFVTRQSLVIFLLHMSFSISYLSLCWQTHDFQTLITKHCRVLESNNLSSYIQNKERKIQLVAQVKAIRFCLEKVKAIRWGRISKQSPLLIKKERKEQETVFLVLTQEKSFWKLCYLPNLKIWCK